MALQNPSSFNTFFDANANSNHTFTYNPLEDDFFYLEEANMCGDALAAERNETTLVSESFVETAQPSEESVDITNPTFAEEGVQKKCLPRTVTGDRQVITEEIVPETFQVEDGEEHQNRTEDAVEGSPQVADSEELQHLAGDAAQAYGQVEGKEPRNPEHDASPEPIQTKDEQIRTPKQHTPEPIQLEDVEESHHPGSDTALESIQVADVRDQGAKETCQSKNVVENIIILRRDLLRACKHKTCPTEDDSNALLKLEGIINGLPSNPVDSYKDLRSANIRRFLTTYINRIPDDDKFRMKERAMTILKKTDNIINSARLSQLPLTLPNTSDIPVCQTKEDIKLGCKNAPIIIDDGATTEEDVSEETSPKARLSKKRKLKDQADPEMESLRRSPRGKTSARQYVSQERQILAAAREKLEHLIQNQQELAQRLQTLEQGLRSVMTSIVELGALEECVSEEWGGE
ncbi:hypothetical protein V501_02276 [Pseudogymnoascus sp. VKM F-4519 (FW-2642)]|nr:hypothetical protein V501_02276 [Pseudogymnoascus sp. VKM F-4519 (FW-2642)]